MDTVYKFVETNGSISMFYDYNGLSNSETLSLNQQLSLDAQTKLVTLTTTYEDYVRIQTFQPTASTLDNPSNYSLQGEAFTNLDGQVIVHAPTPDPIFDTGTIGNDTMRGDDGDDHLFGIAGDDLVDGNGGNDHLFGGDGNDTVTGDAGYDVLFGGSGNDRMNGGAQADILDGGAGNDTLIGGTGDDYLVGGNGNDRIIAGTGNDIVNAGDDHDIVHGDSGNDLIRAGFGQDYVDGGSGNDTVFGDAGDDRIHGGEGNDILFGGEGHDRLDGGAGADTMNGGLGDDVYIVDSSADVISEGTIDGGNDSVVASASFDLGIASNVEKLRLSGSADINATGNERDNTITGNAGANVIVGGAGNDIVYGGGGNDTIHGGLGTDLLFGGAGADSFVFEADVLAGVRATADRIVDFDAEAGDRIDLSALDGNLSLDGNQSFSFVGEAAFSNTSGELRFSASNSTLYGDGNGDGIADFALRIDGAATLHQGDLVL